MKPKLVVLNLVLAAVVCATAWEGRVKWNDAQALRKATLNVPVKPASPPPVLSVPQPETPPAVKYADVAKKNLFSADRNDDIIVDPPPVVKAKPMPPLPVSTGVMRMPSGVKAFMSEKQGDMPRLVKVNDTIGEFKIVALDEHDVTFEWDGKEIKRKVEDLIDRSNDQVASSANAAPPAAGGPAMAPPPPPQPQAPASKGQGVELTQGSRACASGETSPEAMRERPPGTVEDGYKKAVTNSPFGLVCRWVKQ